MVLIALRRLGALRIAHHLIMLNVLVLRRHVVTFFDFVGLRVLVSGPGGAFVVHLAGLLAGLRLSSLLGRFAAGCAPRHSTFASGLCGEFAILGKASALRRDAFTAFSAFAASSGSCEKLLFSGGTLCPPLLAMARCFARSMEANPRLDVPFCSGIAVSFPGFFGFS